MLETAHRPLMDRSPDNILGPTAERFLTHRGHDDGLHSLLHMNFRIKVIEVNMFMHELVRRICRLWEINTVRINVSHHNKIKQDRHYCIYIRFITSINRNMFRLLLSHLQAFFISSISYCCQYEFILCSLIIYIFFTCR
jgi:hypothetical protein